MQVSIRQLLCAGDPYCTFLSSHFGLLNISVFPAGLSELQTHSFCDFDPDIWSIITEAVSPCSGTLSPAAGSGPSLQELLEPGLQAGPEPESNRSTS